MDRAGADFGEIYSSFFWQDLRRKLPKNNNLNFPQLNTVKKQWLTTQNSGWSESGIT